MFVVNNKRYDHSHSVYKCKCGKIVGECACTTDDKHVVVFNSCFHNRPPRYTADGKLAVNQAVPSIPPFLDSRRNKHPYWEDDNVI